MSEAGSSPIAPVFLPDTSAVLALLDNEPGAARMQQILRHEAVLLPFVVSLEVYYISFQERGEWAANVCYGMLKEMQVQHLTEIDEAVVLTAGRFQARYRISLADALIAAFAHRHGAVLVHKDPELEALGGEVRQEILPYKARRHVRR